MPVCHWLVCIARRRCRLAQMGTTGWMYVFLQSLAGSRVLRQIGRIGARSTFTTAEEEEEWEMLYITSAEMCQERRRIKVTPLQSHFFSRFFRFLFFLAAHFSTACGAILRSCYANTHLWLTLLYYNQSSHPACVLRERGGECFQKHATVTPRL